MKENIVVKTHRKIIMGRRVSQIAKGISSLIPKGVNSVLDVGAGTGEMAVAINELRPELEFSGVDVYIRPKTFIPVTEYNGEVLPFDDNSIDAVIIVDVLHHCDDPAAVLKECARVSKRWVIIKENISDSRHDEMVLSFMDWVGNRSHGVVLPYNYLSTLKWQSVIEEAGLKKIDSFTKLKLYPVPFEFLFGGGLHCLYLLEKMNKS